MALEQHVNGPDDLDALLRRELEIVPSASFLSGARARVAAERVAGGGWPWRALVPAGALAVACAVVFGPLGGRTVLPPTPSVPRLAMLAPIESIPADAGILTRIHEPAPSAARRTLRTRAGVLPRVIVDRRQHAALQSVLAMVKEGRLTAEAFAGTIPSSLLPITQGVRPIEVPAVEVSPIPVGGVLQAGPEK